MNCIKIKSSYLISVLILATMFWGCSKKRAENPKVLVFSKTAGYQHASIVDGIAAVQKLGTENGFEVDTTKDANWFTDETLKAYSAIIFLNTTENILDYKQEAAFERYIQAGGGFVGVHAAADTEYDWNWYGKLVGAYFKSHPATQEADFKIIDQQFGATRHFQETKWHRRDELYNFKKINPDIKVIITIDESSYQGGENGDMHPMSWYHEYDGGRAFYTALGHTPESYSDTDYLQHLLGGIQYAIGENMELDYSNVKSQIPPDMGRFSKVVLAEGEFYEPTEMTILPNDDILIGQRRGEILLYKKETGKINQVAILDVYHKTLNTPGVNAEEGLMGIQKDPNFASNNWVYVFYSPTGDEWVNRLSRFKFKDDVFDMDSEQVILDVASQREICCHTGGSIAFGPGNLLYLSTGDNSTPFDEGGAPYVNHGYAPLNDLPGREQYDARRSSGNTNDLRGKIIRIKVNDDGSYDIPEGNLFAPGTLKTRPEIYTMGHRNPYRISVDPKTGWVYWGDVGPDARIDSLKTRGPKGYDEMNQAREAGNFGWPLFIADNKAYYDYDYSTGETGAQFNPEKPINDSENNSGLTELPPAMPAYIYYPYVESKEFPQVETGGRNAMAGPTHYADMYSGDNALPEYYDGKVIIYEWMRGWMKAVSFFSDGTFNKMEPFASNIKVNNLIDMEVGSDGTIYLLEYGSGWFLRNDDSSLGFIQYNPGNRPPVISEIQINPMSGKTPLEIRARVEALDPENDELKYIWSFGDGNQQETEGPSVTYRFDQAGEYKVYVEVKDANEAVSRSSFISVVAGNDQPKISIEIDNDEGTFEVGMPLSYKVLVTDDNKVDQTKVFVSVDYLESQDKASLSLGHQQVSDAVIGKSIMQDMDCKACHKEKESSIGPSYVAVAEKYKNRSRIESYLRSKIKYGSTGIWGEVSMPAHPKIASTESNQIIAYILSLAESDKRSLPLSGTITPSSNEGDNVMIIKASYTDAGTDSAPPLTAVKSIAIPSKQEE